MTSLPQDALFPLRQKAYDRFVNLGWPKPKQEAFQYLPLSQWTLPDPATLPVTDLSSFAAYILPECQESYLVFADGYFLPELSRIPSEIVCLPLDAAQRTYGLFLQNRWTKLFKEETDPLCALNGALHGRGAFLYVPPQTHCQKPLQILHLTTGGASAASRVQITLGSQAVLTVFQTLQSSGFSNNAMDLALDAGSKLHLFDVQLLPEKTRSFFALRATLKRDAHLQAMHATDGSEAVRCSASIELAEENSSAHFRALAMLTNERQAHVHAFVDHAAPYTNSRQHVKMALNGQSRSSFEGKIFVRPIAQKTEAYQLNNNLLLNDQAAAHAKPNLEIFADDVKASHGATFAELSKDELFYLRSRGVPKRGAQTLLTEGFCQELIEQIKLTSLRWQLSQAMQRLLHG